MKYRSWLIVPGASEEQLAAAFGTGADVVVVDLADTVPYESKAHARTLGAQWLAAHRTTLCEHRRMSRWVRINALESGHSHDDLAAVMAAAPDGVILPQASGPEAVRQLAGELYELEQRHAIPANSTRIVPVVGETSRSAMQIADYLGTGHQRLCGLTWSASGLAAALGVDAVWNGAESRSDVPRFVRAQTVLTAHAVQVLAIDAAYVGNGAGEGMKEAASRARADGFGGMFATDASQVEAINAVFTPSAQDVDDARQILSAFEMNPHTAAIPFHGRMVDRSDLARAQRTVHLADAEASGQDGRRKSILRPA
jgi:citrate lyase subunit beta/citryl-CoA lyase